MTNCRDSFFPWLTLAITATVFIGFWFTYFGPMFAGTREPSAKSVHLHGWSFDLANTAAIIQHNPS